MSPFAKEALKQIQMSELLGSHDEMEISGMKAEIQELTTFIFPNSSPPYKNRFPKGSRK